MNMALWRLVYARVSTDAQSLDIQMAAFTALGYDEIFTEKISGRKRDRPQFLALVARAIELRSQGHDVAVYCHEWTRFARNTAVALDNLDRLEKAGCRVIEATTGQAVSLSTADEFLSVGMRSVMSEHFSRQLSDRIKRSYGYRKQMGRPSGNRAPFGYRYSPEAWLPSDDWALARAAVDHYLANGSIRATLMWLSEKGVIKSRNWLWRWLQSPVIRGHQEYHGELVYNTHKALITESEWRTIQQRMQSNRELRGINTNAVVYPVPTSLCVCAHCYRKMMSKSRHTARYLLCTYVRLGSCKAPRNYCRDIWIEAAIQNAIAENAAMVIERVSQDEQGIDPRIADKERDISQLEKMIHVPGVVDAIANLKAEIEQIKTASQVEAVGDAERQELIRELAQLTPEDWESIDAQRRRDLYSFLVARVLIAGSEVVEVVMA